MGRKAKNTFRIPGVYLSPGTMKSLNDFKKELPGKYLTSEIIECSLLEYLSQDWELLEQRLGMKFKLIDVTDYLIKNLGINNGEWNEGLWRVYFKCDWFRFWIDFRVDAGTSTRYTYYNSHIESMHNNIEFDFNLDDIIHSLI
jgi:hypothetical protein